MKDRCFYDTNILLYLHSEIEPEKRSLVIETFKSGKSYISTQVIFETSNVLIKKLKYESSRVINLINELTKYFNLNINKTSTCLLAIEIQNRYKYSFYDSLIIAAALESNCKILYSEDLQHKQIIAKKLKIINPFKK